MDGGMRVGKDHITNIVTDKLIRQSFDTRTGDNAWVGYLKTTFSGWPVSEGHGYKRSSWFCESFDQL